MKSVFPQLQIYASLYPSEAERIIDIFLTQSRKNVSRRTFTAMMPGASTLSIRKALEGLVENEILECTGQQFYQLRMKPSLIAPMTPHRLSKIEIQIMEKLNTHNEITANDVPVSRTVFLKAARRLIERGLLESFESKPRTAVRRYYKFKRQEASSK